MCEEQLSYCIDDVFRHLEQPYSETSLLEKSQQPLKLYIWNNYLLSHFQFYENNRQKEDFFEIETLSFPAKNNAVSWICSKQLLRDDLTEQYRKYLVGIKFETEYQIRSDKKQIRYSDGTFRAIGGNNSKFGVAQIIGHELGMATGTVLKYGIYARAIERIMSAEPNLAIMILMDEIKISHKNIQVLSEQSDEAIKDVFQYTQSNNISHLGYSALDNNMQWTKIDDPVNPPTFPAEEPMIRQMPKYDPDAEISSLALTIPSWISSMERANKQTNYSKTTSYQ